MENGFEINISETDFKAKPQGEQNWILFKGITSVRKCISDIDKNGCEFGKKKYRRSWLKFVSAISAGVTLALGIVYILYQLTSK